MDCAYPSFILTQAKGIPFGRKNGFGERRSVCVSLCALFNALHAHGWRALNKVTYLYDVHGGKEPVKQIKKGGFVSILCSKCGPG